MDNDRSVYIIGARACDGPAITGTRLIECELCKQATHFSPFSINRPEAQTAKFICLPCALDLPGGIAEAGPIEPEQIREMIEALKGRSQ
jgi:hypothetical protein